MNKLLFIKVNFYIILISILFLSLAQSASSEDNSALFKKANELYKLEKYNEVINIYNQLTKVDKNNSELYYNLGNCYYRLDEVGNSILNYEKALKLNPSDEDIKFNLKIANLKTIDKFNTKEQLEIVVFYNDFVNNLHSNTWLYLSIMMLLIALYSISSFIFNKESIKQKLNIIVFSITIILFLTFTIFSYSTYQMNQLNNFAILKTSNTYIKSSPETNGKNLIMIHEGLKLEILEKNENWTKVKLPDGNIGWLESSQISNI